MSEAVWQCIECDTAQRLPEMAPATITRCVRCRTVLERTFGRSMEAALACSAATLLLLIPGNLGRVVTTNLLGATRHSVIASTAGQMWRDGWPLLAVAVFLFLVALPLARFALLTLILALLRQGRDERWLGPAFRWANLMETWSMPDVFLLGFAVAYTRLASSITVRIGTGAVCYIAAGVLALFVRALLDKKAVWRRIMPEPDMPPGDDPIPCLHCELPAPGDADGRPCRRCGATLRRRKPESIGTTVALTLAAMLLYVPANLYPLATLPINDKPQTYTVLGGVIELVQARLWDLALLVFTASFVIPILKLIGLSWCLLSVLRRSRAHLVAKARTFRVVEEIGRWSMLDPFVIGCFAPVVHYNAFIYGRAQPGAFAFALVVILTMIGAKAFDPRLMWDAAGARR